jgi:hypothetical protein
MRPRNGILVGLLMFLVVLVGLRVALPDLLLDYVNDQLNELEAYEGSVQDIDLALWRGAYGIDGIRIVKRGKRDPVPFFSSDRLDLSVQWRSLFHGALVSEATFTGPNLNLIQETTERESQLGTEEDWRARIEGLFPFRFNTIEIRYGTATFRAPGIRTEEALNVERINGTFANLTNVADADKEAYADFSLTGAALGDAPVTVSGSLDPWSREPTFDVNLELTDVALPKVNPWLREYIKADAERGEFELYLEVAAADRRFTGYAKPIMRDVDMTSAKENEGNPLRKLWEGIVDFAADVLENKQEEQVAARMPFSGSIEEPKSSVWATLVSIVRNAFVGAFARSLEGSISIRDVKKSLEPYAADDPAGERTDDERQSGSRDGDDSRDLDDDEDGKEGNVEGSADAGD